MPLCGGDRSLSVFNWDARDYRQHSGAQKVWARELIDRLNLNGTESILDLGCGDGRIAAELAARVPQGRVLGVDNAPGMIQLAGESFPAAQYPNLRFQLGDASRLDFEQAFEVVFSNAALHWVKEHQPVLDGIGRSLIPGGRILLQMGGKGNVRDIQAATDEVRSRAEWQETFTGFISPYGFYSPEEYRPWLEKAGLRPTRVELLEKYMLYPQRSGLEGWVRTAWLPYTLRVPVELRETFIGDLVDCYLQRFPADAQGVIRVHMMRLEVEAEKPLR